MLSGEKQESWQHYGVFNNDKCYLVLYSTVNTTVPVHLIYYWLVSILYRGSYISAHVLLNSLNELGKRDKMRGLPSILSLFRNELNKFNNTRA